MMTRNIAGLKIALLITIIITASQQFSANLSYPTYMVNAQGILSSIREDVIQSEASSVYFVFPDHDINHSKPPGVYPALLSDWTALGFLYGMCLNMPQNIAPDTRATLLKSETGSPLIADTSIVLFGGPIVNSAVNYYESSRSAPLYYQYDGVNNIVYWYTADGTRLDETAMPASTVSNDKDMFVIEAFFDESGNRVFIIYGYGWKGTFAGGKFFKFVIYPNIDVYTDSFYIFKWIDDNSDGFVDIDEIPETPIAHG